MKFYKVKHENQGGKRKYEGRKQTNAKLKGITPHASLREVDLVMMNRKTLRNVVLAS